MSVRLYVSQRFILGYDENKTIILQCGFNIIIMTIVTIVIIIFNYTLGPRGPLQ